MNIHRGTIDPDFSGRPGPHGEMFAAIPDPHHAAKKESWYIGKSNEFAAMRAMGRFILERAQHYQWTVQGFGMIRTYIPAPESKKRFRFNVWDSRLAVPNVSIMHDHPWSFDSWIINGGFDNVRYVEDPLNGDAFQFMTIKTGTAGQWGKSQGIVRLRAMPSERYGTGDKYHQDADEIHASFPDNGTVTLNDRLGDTEHARVFWHDGDWVDAKPRDATPAEVSRTIGLALELWQ